MSERSDSPVPYEERLRMFGHHGHALIWPFVNYHPGRGPLELVLDNNALENLEWLSQLVLSLPRRGLAPNLILALVEQWLSNSAFRCDPEGRIKRIVSRFNDLGFMFRPDYPASMANLLRCNESQFRYSWSILLLYVAIIKKLFEHHGSKKSSLPALIRLSNADVPRLAGCLTLAALSLFLKERQRLYLPCARKPAIADIAKFLDFRKEEGGHLSQQYLCNRSADLMLWYALPLLESINAKWIGDPVIVTGDKSLYQLVFRVIPPMRVLGPSLSVAFCPAFNELSEEDRQPFFELHQQLNWRFKPPRDSSEKLQRLRNLLHFAKDCCDSSLEKTELEAAWAVWIEPGFDQAFVF